MVVWGFMVYGLLFMLPTAMRLVAPAFAVGLAFVLEPEPKPERHTARAPARPAAGLRNPALDPIQPA